MKITAQEEYGLRIILRIAQSPEPEGITLPEISRAEGLTIHNVAKLCRILRLAGLIKSSRGKSGGYTLAKVPARIKLGEILEALGGRLFDEAFCGNHTGVEQLCTNSLDCTIRSIWQIIQINVNQVVDKITLENLLRPASALDTLQTCEPREIVRIKR